MGSATAPTQTQSNLIYHQSNLIHSLSLTSGSSVFGFAWKIDVKVVKFGGFFEVVLNPFEGNPKIRESEPKRDYVLAA